jgi:hypothetical protein
LGSINSPAISRKETAKADELRHVAVNFLHDENEILREMCSTLPFLLYKTANSQFSSTDDRIRAMSSTGTYTGNLELSVASYLLKSQLVVYQRHNLDNHDRQNVYRDQKPILLLSREDTLNQPGHFDLLLTSTQRKTYPLSRSVQDIVNEQEQTCREPERSLAFKVILDPSITNYWSATSYIELGQSSPSTDRLKTHAASSISRQESHPEVSTRGSESHSGQGTPDVHSDSPLTDIGLVIGKVITDKDKYSLLTSHWTPDVLYKFPSHMEYGM